MSKKQKEENISNIKSADDLIIKMESEKLGNIIPPEPPKEEINLEPPKEEVKADSQEDKEDVAEKEGEEKEDKEEVVEGKEDEKESKEVVDKADEEVDEYGTKIGKKKLYTEDEVQRMIRERLKRGQHAEQNNQEINQAAKEFVPNPDSEESWEQQLETFVENTLHKINKKQSEEEWRQREKENMAEFEVKFTNGMGKYQDFTDVVKDKPITNAMMLATRSMNDPAAFLYAACKQYPKELAKISEIKDVVTQATEIGRLEERMKKARAISSSPKPATKISGDKSDEMPQLDIEARIAQHAKSKIMMRR